MSGRLSEEKIEEIKNSVDITEIIGGYLPLRKSGRNYVTNCPFHKEKTPSFNVSPQKQIFHCFGCSKGGNVFTFLMDYKNITFFEALQEVAAYTGIKIDDSRSSDASVRDENEELYQINRLAALFFSEKLLKETEGKGALEYLKNRKLKERTIRSLGIGFAPHGYDNFLKYAERNSIDLEKAKHLGLLDKKESGGYYDKFRGRIIFPIFSTNGRVIGFGGRVLEKSDTTAKYLNSPNSQIYNKSRVLYGLYQAKDEIRIKNFAFLVEGYMDFISLYQAEIKNVVASSGTALTDEQVKLLTRFTKNVTVVYDADGAGQRAAMRSIEIFLKNDCEVKIFTLPDGEDPDTYIKKLGKEEFIEASSKAQNFIEFQADYFKQNGSLDSPASSAESIREIVRNISFIPDELKRTMFLGIISKRFNLRENLLEKELKSVLSSDIQKFQPQTPLEVPQKTPTDNKGENLIRISLFEKELIYHLLRGNIDVSGKIFDVFHPEDFKSPSLSILANIIYESYLEDIFDLEKILDRVTDPKLKEYALKLMLKIETISLEKWGASASEESYEEIMKREAIDLINKIHINKIDEEMARLAKEAEIETDEIKLIEILRLQGQLSEERNKLVVS